MNKVDRYIKAKNRVIKNSQLSKAEMIEKLSQLLSDMAVEYSVPLIYDDVYKEKNKDVVAVFESIRDEIKRLHSSWQTK